MGHIKTKDGTELYFKEWGTGRPVILMHGWPLSADSWDDQAMAIAEAGFRVIAYDRRGFGRSSQPWSGYDYDTLSDDLASVLEQTVARDATIVGFSMGGGEVARYMSRHFGKDVVQAVLVSSVVPFMLKTNDNPNGVDPSVFEGMTKAMKQDRAKFFTGFFKDFYSGDSTSSPVSQPVSQEVLEWSRSIAMQAGLNATLGCAQAFSSTDFRPDLPAFSVPTLIIHGTADKTVPIDASGRQAAKMIANSHLIEYDGAPHGLFATHGPQLSKDLIAFLKRHELVETLKR
jgi:non-heme chloroperoxidase